ncbi:nuclear transport factor 2-like protein [Chryseobacterium arachidis]|nr:hypothetical protein [Chryseobacterium arachidis]
MANMYTENAEFKDPTLAQGIVRQTKQQIIEKYTRLSNMCPDVTDKVIKTFPSGDNHIDVEFVLSGTAG